MKKVFCYALNFLKATFYYTEWTDLDYVMNEINFCTMFSSVISFIVFNKIKNVTVY